MSVRTTMTCLILLMLAAIATGAAAQTQDYRFHWAPSPAEDAGGTPLPAAVAYQVWLREDAEPPRLVATVDGDTTYTLAAQAGVVSRIRVCGLDDQGVNGPMSEWSDPVYFEQETRGGAVLPAGAALQGNYPNPFNPQTVIRYGVPDGVATGTPVRLEVYTLDGRRVRRLEVDRSPGWHDAVWDGTDDRGRSLATGIYLSRFVVGDAVATGKMTLLK